MFDTASALGELISALEKDIKERPDPRLAELAALQHAFATIMVGGPPPPLRENSKKHQFREMVTSLLMETRDDRVHRQDIIREARNANMFPGSKDIDRDVSKYLSTDGNFVPDGDGYWKKKAGPKLILELGGPTRETAP